MNALESVIGHQQHWRNPNDFRPNIRRRQTSPAKVSSSTGELKGRHRNNIVYLEGHPLPVRFPDFLIKSGHKWVSKNMTKA